MPPLFMNTHLNVVCGECALIQSADRFNWFSMCIASRVLLSLTPHHGAFTASL